MNSLYQLIKKEIKETIRNPRFLVFTILLPLLLYPAMGLLINMAMESTGERIKHGTIIIVDNDGSNISKALIKYLELSGLKVLVEDNVDTMSLNSSVLGIIKIPKEFETSILNENPPNISIITILNGLNVAEQSLTTAITTMLEGFKEYLKGLIAQKHGINPEIVTNPFKEYNKIYVRSWGREFNENDLGPIMMQIMFWPWLIFSLVISVIQLSAIFLGEEKEQKTLEILLTLPVRRTIILLSKVLGSGFLALLATLSYSIGFIVYINVFSEFMAGFGFTIDFSLDPLSILLMGIIFFLSLLFSSALGLSMSVLAQDTRSAESLAGAAVFPLMVIAFSIMFMDISTMPKYIQLILYMIPYTYLMEGLKYLLIGKYDIFFFGIIVNMVGALVMLTAVSRIFTTERILTMRVRLRRKKGH